MMFLKENVICSLTHEAVKEWSEMGSMRLQGQKPKKSSIGKHQINHWQPDRGRNKTTVAYSTDHLSQRAEKAKHLVMLHLRCSIIDELCVLLSDNVDVSQST